MPYDPQLHRRRSLRLKGYDYSQAGAYFVTICTQDFRQLLADAEVKHMIDAWWGELPSKFPTVELDAQVVMPNHIHGVIVICDPIGREHCPNLRSEPLTQSQMDAVATQEPLDITLRTPPTLAQIVRWFKTMTTNAYIRGVKELNWRPFTKRLWHRNYYEQIIRNDRHLMAIRRYISENPAVWNQDVYHPDARFQRDDHKRRRGPM